MSIESWLDHKFESSCYTTPEFVLFCKEYKKEIKKRLPEDCKIVSWNRGHFYVSAFIKNEAGKYVYLSMPDVRYSPNEWFNSILVRTAQHEKDYTGGSNCYSTLDNLQRNIDFLLRS